MSIDGGIYSLRDSVLAVDTNGETILMDTLSGKYFGIRGAMSRVLQPLRNGMALEDMVALVSREYAVTPGVAADDVRAILTRLVDAGLVQQVEPGGA